jgi:hypothetical protein
MPWGVAAAVGGAVIGAKATGDAADTQAAAAAEANALQRYMYDTTRADQAPYREAGVDALGRLRGFSDRMLRPDEVMAEPGYQFGLREGIDNIESTAAARGGLYSGNTLKGLTRFANDYATTKFNEAWNRSETAQSTRWNRLAALAGIGQTATNQVQSAGQNYANGVGNTLMSNANAQGAAGMARADIWGNALNQLGSAASRGNWFGGTSTPYRADDPYSNPGYVGGMEGE